MLDAGNMRDRERERLLVDSFELSTWQRYCPNEVWRDPVLSRMANYLDEPKTRELFDLHEVTEDYPEAVVRRLSEIGLAEILAPRRASTRFTPYHMCALNAMTARRDTSVAVTLSVNVLGLLPAYIAANEEQLAAIGERVEAGKFAALLLSELPHGSNILRNQARAEPGTLSAAGEFVSVGDGGASTHYRLNGEKHLINGATEHDLLFVCLRTRNFDAYDDECAVPEPLKARGDFTMFWLDRGPGMVPVARYYTLPARSADISGLRFENCIVPADRILGREHGGLAIIHKTLMLSRGGVSALAAGCLNRARDLALTYAERRNVYGQAIRQLGAVAEHLMQLEAFNLAVSAVSLKATSLLNAIGLAASHYTSVAKLMACGLAEEGVTAGQRVLGARSLMRELPYERLIRDVNLYGIFDGTSHLMLEELSTRLALECRPRDASADATIDPLREVYGCRPRSATETLREFRRPVIFPLVGHLQALEKLGGEASLAPFVAGAQALFATVDELRGSNAWKQDQGRRFAAAETFALFEVLVAIVELCDPERRSALGIRRPTEFDEPRDRACYEYAMGFFGSRALASVRQLLLGAGLDDRLTGVVKRLHTAERELLEDQDRRRHACREALKRV